MEGRVGRPFHELYSQGIERIRAQKRSPLKGFLKSIIELVAFAGRVIKILGTFDLMTS